MIEFVVKHDGRKQPFDADKLNKWAHVADRHGVSWSELAQDTYKRLNDGCGTDEIHETMTAVALSRESLPWSRVAARLEYATLRKNMDKHLGISDKDSFAKIFFAMTEEELWDIDSLPGFNPRWNDWYLELREHYFEYWQIKQWMDKYAVRVDEDTPVETPHMGCLGIALAMFGDTDRAFEAAKALVAGKINLPTPATNGCRNGDWDTISCCVTTGGDSVDSIGVAEHIAYKMTAKKAGIGIEMRTRSVGEDVRGGQVKHLGKAPIYQTVDKAVKMFTQVTRGGSATMSYACIDPEIEKLLLLKSQRTDIEQRVDKMDYSFVYNDAFANAVLNNEEWNLYSYLDHPEVHEAFYGPGEAYLKVAAKATPAATLSARELLKLFLTVRGETGRVYATNASRMNSHTPFEDTVYLSNLCQEIALPTKPYVNMADLYGPKSEGETAFCTLAAINVMNLEDGEYEAIAELALRMTDVLMDNVTMMSESMQHNLHKRRSVGIGITGLAGCLYKRGLDYDNSVESREFCMNLADDHYFYLLKASQKIAQERDFAVEGINTNWLPIDTAINVDFEPTNDWESLRDKPRAHSVLVAHMPTESSAVFSNATNGLYPVRQRVINKSSRKGKVQFIAPEGDYQLAWDIENNVLSSYYGIFQDKADQGISADYYETPSKHPGGKVPLSKLMKDFIAQWRAGCKTMYYSNTNDDNGGSFQDQACTSCTI